MAELTFVIPSVLNGGQGEKRLDIQATSLTDAFATAAKSLGSDFARRALEPNGSPKALINIYINGKNAKFSDGMNTELKDGDEIYILPAVAGGSELSEADLDRYSRQVMLEEIGYTGQLKLRDAKVCVVGVGGLGNPIVSRLVAMGIGTMRIVDRDFIERSNLHRQTLFDEEDVGEIKVAAAERKLKRLNSDVSIETLPISVNDYNAYEVIAGCDVVIDALDSVNARYALNKACVKENIPFVTGAAVGVTGQVFTVLPGKSACYHCMFPALEEDAMPTCSIEGVHPPILSIVGGLEVAEAVRILLDKKPGMSERILHIDLNGPEFSYTRTFRVPECPVCGTGSIASKPKENLIIEELCGRRHDKKRGMRTFSLTPTAMFDLDVDRVTDTAKMEGYAVENQGDLGLAVHNADFYASFMRKGSAILVGPSDEESAVTLYNKLLGKNNNV